MKESNQYNYYSKIKEYRMAKNLTIKELAEKANITSSMLSQIERGLANPSINTMKLIAQALDTPLFKFFMENNNISNQVVTPERRKRISLPGEDGVIYELLTPDLTGSIEFCILTLAPGKTTSEAPMGHEGEEVALVLSGTTELILENEKLTMNAGDSIRIPPRTNHKWYNPTDENMILIFAVSPPTF
ncbi:MAG: helix-turn-helix domain-containing protein [Thermoanaerobacteraceae bacterium]|jgi:transcriptional regulator with XRE-family HTH domain|nr:helix-turn-helix domain-containing protein [Thermoanaerobacteraceae bacterium]